MGAVLHDKGGKEERWRFPIEKIKETREKRGREGETRNPLGGCYHQLDDRQLKVGRASTSTRPSRFPHRPVLSSDRLLLLLGCTTRKHEPAHPVPLRPWTSVHPAGVFLTTRYLPRGGVATCDPHSHSSPAHDLPRLALASFTSQARLWNSSLLFWLADAQRRIETGGRNATAALLSLPTVSSVFRRRSGSGSSRVSAPLPLLQPSFPLFFFPAGISGIKRQRQPPPPTTEEKYHVAEPRRLSRDLFERRPHR